jgi:hypothetical protein
MHTHLGVVDQAVIIADNAALNKTSAEFCLPIVTYSTVESDGVCELEYVEYLPVADPRCSKFST